MCRISKTAHVRVLSAGFLQYSLSEVSHQHRVSDTIGLPCSLLGFVWDAVACYGTTGGRYPGSLGKMPIDIYFAERAPFCEISFQFVPKIVHFLQIIA